MQKNNASYFDGRPIQLIGWKILLALVIFFTLGLAYPWAVCKLFEWEAKHTVINGHRLVFTGRAFSLFTLWIKWWILCIITLGIYSLWVDIDLKKWKTKHTHFEE